MIILGLDPGPEHSGWALYDSETRRLWVPDGDLEGDVQCADEDNATILSEILHYNHVVACEWIESFGMPVGRDVFETCYQIGRLARACEIEHVRFDRVTRREVKLHLCGSTRGTDANVRQAIIDRYGKSKAESIGVKKKPGPLYGVKGHAWQALAVAITWAETRMEAKP